MAQREFKQHYPRPGWVEHDPLDIWKTQSAVAAEAVTAANLSTHELAALGITNQRETLLVWDRKTGEPVYPAIVWQDRRTADRCKQLKEAGHEPGIREKTGLLIDPYFSGTKLQWILENVDGVRARAERREVIAGTVDTWLVWKLTQGRVHITDVSNASRTLLYNIHKLEWDTDILELLDIPLAMLPAVQSSAEVYGEIAESHLLGGVPIAGIAGDQQAALFGQACFEKGMVKNTYGTGCFLLMHTGSERVESNNKLLTTIAWQVGDRVDYALEGSVFIGGAVVQWLRDEMQIIQSAPECDMVAETVADTNGLYLVPAFTGLGAPHWDPYARGTAFGLTRGTNRAHFCRAALEAIAYQSGDLIRAMELDSGLTLHEVRVDGGAARSQPLMQFQADLLQCEVVRPQTLETTALGAAYLAGIGVGYYEGIEAIHNNWAEESRFSPSRPQAEMERLWDGWTQAVKRTRSV